MIRNVLCSIGLTVLALALWGHTPGTGGSDSATLQPRILIQQANPWTRLNWNDDPARFQFAIVADRTGGHRPGVFAEAIGKLNLLQPEFVMSVGDLIEGYSEDRPLLQSQWAEIEGFVGQLGMPFFYVPGNHDLSNPVQVEEWKQRFGRLYYHFVYKDVLFLCLDSEDPPDTHISAAQIEYAAQALQENPDVRWTLVFLHKPLWIYQQDTGWQPIEDLLADRPHTVFAGHYHTYTRHERHDTSYFVLATTGGASSLRGPVFGQFDHVVWVTMTDAGPRVANLMLKGIWDENVRTTGTAALVDALLMGMTVSSATIFTDQKTFKGGSAQLRLTNDADLPMRVSGRFQPHAGLAVSPAGIDTVVPPNSVELVDLNLRPLEKKLKIDGLDPLTLNWQVAYDMEGQPIELDGASRVVIERQLDCPKGGKKTIDGDLDDWKKLPFVCQQPAQVRVAPDSWKGPDDSSFRFGVEYDDAYLYIAVEVTDEQLVLSPQRNPWDQDGIEVRLDARPDPIRSNGRGYVENTDFLAIALSPGQTPEEMVYHQREALEKQGIEAICVRTAKGHDTEIAIPRSYMDEKQGENWQAFRLNIAVDDHDETDGPLAQLWWRPDWRYELNYPGSGTFTRR